MLFNTCVKAQHMFRTVRSRYTLVTLRLEAGGTVLLKSKSLDSFYTNEIMFLLLQIE